MRMLIFPLLALLLGAFQRLHVPAAATSAAVCTASSAAAPIHPAMVAYATAPAPAPKPAGVASNLLFQSIDGGANWQDLSAALPADLQVNCISVQGGEVFLGGNNGWVYHSTDPSAGIWQQMNIAGFMPNKWTGTVTNIWSGRSGLYACVTQEGFYRQIPGTSLWYPMHKQLADKQVNAVAETPSGTLVVTCHSGIYTSDNGGSSWNHVYLKGWVSNLRTEGEMLLAQGEFGPLQSSDGGAHWEFAPILDPLCMSPGKPVFDQAQVGNTRFCSHEGGISCSTNNGKGWKLVRSMDGMGKNARFELVVLGQTVLAVKMTAGC